jgi:hypothetical protein
MNELASACQGLPTRGLPRAGSPQTWRYRLPTRPRTRFISRRARMSVARLLRYAAGGSLEIPQMREGGATITRGFRNSGRARPRAGGWARTLRPRALLLQPHGFEGSGGVSRMSQGSRRCRACSRSNVSTASSASGWWCFSMSVPLRISHLPTAMKATSNTTKPITPQSTALTASTNATASGFRRCARLSSPDASYRGGLRLHVLLRHRLLRG